MTDDEKKENIRWAINFVGGIALVCILVWKIININSRLEALEQGVTEKERAAQIESEMQWGATYYSAQTIGWSRSPSDIEHSYKAGYQDAVNDLDEARKAKE